MWSAAGTALIVALSMLAAPPVKAGDGWYREFEGGQAVARSQEKG